MDNLSKELDQNFQIKIRQNQSTNKAAGIPK
jgi:hypothetical protein